MGVTGNMLRRPRRAATYDPSAHTIDEVLGHAHLRTSAELEALHAAEETGKGRVTLLNHLSDLIVAAVEAEYTPSGHTVDEVIGYVDDRRTDQDLIHRMIAAEEAGAARVTLLDHLHSLVD